MDLKKPLSTKEVLICLVGAVASVLLVTWSDWRKLEKIDTPPAESIEAKEKRLDTSITPVKSCDWSDLEKQIGNVAGVSHADQVAVCKEVALGLGRPPSVMLVRTAAKIAFLFATSGSRESPKDIIFSMMNVVQARGKTSDQDVYNTMDILYRVHAAFNGRVTPAEINTNLRQMGPMAKTLDDDGLASLAAMILEMKKS